MLDVLLSITLSSLTVFFTLPVVLIIANQKNLFDIPNERKIHTSQIASLVHHLLLRKGFSCKNITLLVLTDFALIVFAFIGNGLGSTWLILVQSAVFFACIGLLVRNNKPISSLLSRTRWATIKSISLQ